VTEQVHHHHGGRTPRCGPRCGRRSATTRRCATCWTGWRTSTARSAPGRASSTGTCAPSRPRRRPAGTVGLTAWRAFSEVFLAHLAHEERAAVPVLERRLPPRRCAASRPDQQRALGLRVTMTRFFPWLIEDASPHRRQHVLGCCPRRCAGWCSARSAPPAPHRRRGREARSDRAAAAPAGAATTAVPAVAPWLILNGAALTRAWPTPSSTTTSDCSAPRRRPCRRCRR
jgi:hypothetical protein